jgi:hypothetical protein
MVVLICEVFDTSTLAPRFCKKACWLTDPVYRSIEQTPISATEGAFPSSARRVSFARAGSRQAKGRAEQLTPLDSQNLSTGDVRACDGTRNVDTGESGLRSGKGDKGRSKAEHFIEIDELVTT